jgi:SAM-dependent methyltransferase
MVTNAFAFLCRYAPLRRTLWREVYQFLARHYRHQEWTFMNYGYAGVPVRETIALDSRDEPDRYCIQLYNFVAGATDLTARRVLEVGSGRGGGASFIKRYLAPEAVTGVDFSQRAIDFCTRRHNLPGLSFRRGDAEALPFPDESFDAVVNVESSHCYGSMDAFLGEVRRVLVPGGQLLHADLRKSDGARLWREQLERSRMAVVRESDITANVLLALDADNDRKAGLIGKVIPRRLQSAFSDFAALRGSAIYEGFRSRRVVYRSYVLQKN